MVKVRFTDDTELRDSILKALKENKGYCPCRKSHTPDTKCQCKEFREQDEGVCHCGLYVKEKVDG